jgi:hypothetical protein
MYGRFLSATDFTPYCITAPKDNRLPDGGGNQICGLHDVSATKFGVATNNIVTARHAFHAVIRSREARVRPPDRRR